MSRHRRAAMTAKIKSERGYGHSDIVNTEPPGEDPAAQAAFAAALSKFYVEHMHALEEIRHVRGRGQRGSCDAPQSYASVSYLQSLVQIVGAGWSWRPA